MRVAVLADIHGNSLALDAVFADIQAAGGVDAYWILGDLVAIGHDPAGTLERLSALPDATFIHGNTDYYVTSSKLPPPTLEDVRANPDLLPVFAEVAGSFGWTKGCLTPGDWLAWLENLPLDQRITLPNGTRVLLVHAAPGKNDGDGIHWGTTDAELALLVESCEADLVLVGHTHCAFDRSINGVRVINPGPVSNAFPPDLRASYVLIDASETGFQIEFRRADYDHQAVIESMRHSRYPGAPYVASFMEGRMLSGWLKKWLAAQPGKNAPPISSV